MPDVDQRSHWKFRSGEFEQKSFNSAKKVESDLSILKLHALFGNHYDRTRIIRHFAYETSHINFKMH